MMQEYTTEHTSLNDQIVGDFLRQDPLFFERNAHLLAEIFLPSPHGHGTISLIERQQLAQRDKVHATESKMAELIEYAKQNNTTTEKMHQLSLALMSHQQLPQISDIVAKSMQDAFNVDHSHLTCWMPTHNADLAQQPIFAPASQHMMQWVSRLEQPYCGAMPTHLDMQLDEALQSFAFIPLFKTLENPTSAETMPHLPAIGVLILASKDPAHFKPEMGTVFLSRIGDLVSVALACAIAPK